MNMPGNRTELLIFLSNSFEDAIRTAISVGGDSDTLLQLPVLSQRHIIAPEDIKIRSYLDDYLRAIFDEWYRFIGCDTITR